jgi:hypothetical protein
MYHAVAEVDVCDLDGAQLAPWYAGDRDKPHVQRDVVLTGGTGLVGRVGLEPTTGG